MSTPHTDVEGEGGQSLACNALNAELFFSENPRWQAAARDLCQRCPARRPCLAWGVVYHEDDGVWGGLGRPAREQLAARIGLPVTEDAALAYMGLPVAS